MMHSKMTLNTARLFLTVSAVGLLAQAAAAEDLLPQPEGLSRSLRETAMPELDGSKVGKILSRYYTEGLGGPERWVELESLKMKGTMELDSGSFQLRAYQKKPNLMKLSVRHLENQTSIDLGFDGSMAWEKPPRQDAQPMTPEKSRRFGHSAIFGSYLLFPYAEGKTIRLIDTVPVEGAICHHLRVTLDSEYQIDYFLDIRSFLEVKVVNTDLRTGATNHILYEDYERASGWPVATTVESYEGGEWVSSLRLEDIRVNTGVMPWMFRMPE
jgi:hypothetical protein